MEKSKKQPSSQEHKPVGRPRLTNELLDVNLQVRVTKKLADTCKSLGGANFMRPLLEAATQRAMALKKLAPARPGEESEGIKFIDLTVQCGFPSPAADYAENDLSHVDNVVLIHLSDGNADEARFVREVKELTGKAVCAARAGMTLDLSKTPY